jgi:hypothetical protein
MRTRETTSGCSGLVFRCGGAPLPEAIASRSRLAPFRLLVMHEPVREKSSFVSSPGSTAGKTFIRPSRTSGTKTYSYSAERFGWQGSQHPVANFVGDGHHVAAMQAHALLDDRCVVVKV